MEPLIFLVSAGIASYVVLDRAKKPQKKNELNPKFGYPIRSLFPTNFKAPMVEQSDSSLVCTTHLNHGSYGVAPFDVSKAQRKHSEMVERWPDDFFRRKALPLYTKTANIAASFIGAPEGSVVFVENATTGVNAVLSSLQLTKNDAILVNNHTYNACKNTARHICERFGATLIVQDITLPLPETDDGIVADFEAYLDANAALTNAPQIKFALIDHITSPTAIVMPVERLSAACRKRGILVMIDGAHAPGMLDLKISIDCPSCDWYTGNLHKWVYTPKGVAVLYTRKDKQDMTSAAVISHFYKKSYIERFYMIGTNDQSRLLATPDALKFIDDRLGGLAAMREYNTNLINLGVEILCQAWNVQRMYPKEKSCPFLAVVECPLDWKRWVRTLEGNELPLDVSDIEAEVALAQDEGFNERVACAILFSFGIQTVFFTWKVGGKMKMWNRTSAQVYNVREDYEHLARAVITLGKQTKSLKE
jgi:isopenicillin-N epimerase